MAEHAFGNMEAFDPGDWQMYTEQMEQFFVANGIGLRCLGGTG